MPCMHSNKPLPFASRMVFGHLAHSRGRTYAEQWMQCLREGVMLVNQTSTSIAKAFHSVLKALIPDQGPIATHLRIDPILAILRDMVPLKLAIKQIDEELGAHVLQQACRASSPRPKSA